MKSIKSLVILGVLMVAAVPAFAATAPATVTVNANVSKMCAWNSDATLDFGAYDPFLGTAVTGSTTIGLRCTKGAALVTVDLATDRVMTNTVDNLNYTLTRGGLAWDDGANTFTYVALNSGWYTITINGEITAGQDVSDGSYTDTVIATINY